MSASANGGPSRLLLVTGLSGAGKSSALKIFEDLGYEAVDNLPLRMLAGLTQGRGRSPALAVGVDSRTRDFDVDAFADELARLRRQPCWQVELVFFDSDDEVLRRRFSETRRRHPLAVDRPVTDGIRRERELMAPLVDRADYVIDSSMLAVGELRRLLQGRFALDREPPLTLCLTSFAFRRGLPREADLVFDVRFLANPHYQDRLRVQTGLEPEVVAFIERDPHFADFFERLCAMLLPLLPRYADEGKRYLTIAVGCTGGRHRSVMVAQKLAQRLSEAGFAVQVRHRDIDSNIN